MLVCFTKFTSLEISQKHGFQFKRTSQEICIAYYINLREALLKGLVIIYMNF